jgi:Fe-S-cluster-containing hydrogenase component 2
MSILVNWLESLHEEMKVSSRCVRERNRKSSCGFCVQTCKQNAFEIKDHLLILDTNKCTMCGECMLACPLSAIEGVLSNRVFDGGSLVFNYNYVPSIKELLIYKKRGMTSIQVSQQPLSKEWKTVVSQSNDYLQMLDEDSIEVVQKVKEEVLSRRAFFGSFQKEGKQLAKSMAPAAWKMKQDDWKITRYYPDYQFFTVQLNKEKCTLCQACFALCPENVFQIKNNKLVIQNEKCVNCTSCTDVCPENTIEIILDVKSIKDSQENVHLKACIVCEHPFYTFNVENEKCPVCANRDPDWLSPY